MNNDKKASTVWLEPVGEQAGFRVRFRDDHVHVSLGKGLTVEPGQGDDLWATVKEMCGRHDSSRVLVEGHVPGGEHDTGSVIGAGLRTAAIPDLWMAFCFNEFEPTEQSELYETIASRSGTHIKFFSDPDKALKWLRVNTPR